MCMEGVPCMEAKGLAREGVDAWHRSSLRQSATFPLGLKQAYGGSSRNPDRSAVPCHASDSNEFSESHPSDSNEFSGSHATASRDSLRRQYLWFRPRGVESSSADGVDSLDEDAVATVFGLTAPIGPLGLQHPRVLLELARPAPRAVGIEPGRNTSCRNPGWHSCRCCFLSHGLESNSAHCGSSAFQALRMPSCSGTRCVSNG